jgi:tetratricopeptide (TPR) repeat protein
MRAAAPAVPDSAESVLNDPFVRETAQTGLEQLYGMEFDAARSTFQRIDARYPNHPIGPFLEALNIWWKILLDMPDTSHDEAFFGKMEQVIARCDEILRRDGDNFDAKFFKGAALGFRGRLRSNRGNWLGAVYDANRAIGFVRDVDRKNPAIKDYLFGTALYDYYAATIPERYPVSKVIMFLMPDGDKERGLRLLKRVAEEGWYVRTEATYFLTQIYFLYEEEYGMARQYITQLRQWHPDNAYFHVMEGRIHVRWGRWTEAQAVFDSVATRHARGQSGYNDYIASIAHYYLGRERMIRDDHDEALRHFQRLRALADPEHQSDVQVMGRLRLGMVYDALGERQKARDHYRDVLQMKDENGAHDRARRYLREPYTS